MTNTVLSIVVFAMIVRSCTAAIVTKTMEPEGRALLYEAAIDTMMTCYGDPGNAVGIVGDSDGSLLKTLRSNYLIPAVLLDNTSTITYGQPAAKRYKLQVFVIATNSLRHLFASIIAIRNSVWWNVRGNFLIVDADPDLFELPTRSKQYLLLAKIIGLLNVQFVSLDHTTKVIIFNSNPFTRYAPKSWNFMLDIEMDKAPLSLFMRFYKKGGETCEDINFDKTTNVGGYPLYFSSGGPASKVLDFQDFKNKEISIDRKLLQAARYHYKWFMDNIVIAMNASAVIIQERKGTPDITLHPRYLSNEPKVLGETTDQIILTLEQWPFFAVTNHTGHKSQLKKIISVIDTKSQIGMCIVYVITFFFFKFFVGEAVVPALLNLVRLTCGTGLTRLPQNVAPTIYLACLFMFVVTMIGIFTGNLATLLTSTIPYPNVETIQDIPKLGYTAYVRKDMTTKLVGDPTLDGHIVEIPTSKKCKNYLLTDPLAVCVLGLREGLLLAIEWNLHMSKEPIMNEYIYYYVRDNSLFTEKLEKIIKTWIEIGIHPDYAFAEALRFQFVEDDEVKKNVERRVMTMADLGFAFVILGVGLIFSFICFIGEIVVWKIRLKIMKRRQRVRARLAWGVPEKKFSLKSVFNVRRLISKRR